MDGFKAGPSQKAFPLARDDQQPRGLIRCHGLREHGNRNHRINRSFGLRLCDAGAHDDVRRHQMTEERNLFCLRKGAGGSDHAARLGHQKGGCAIHRHHITRHRDGILAVTFEVKGKHPLARLRQRQGIRLHHLAGSGKPMRHDDNRAGLVRQLIQRHRRGAHVEGRYFQACSLTLQLPAQAWLVLTPNGLMNVHYLGDLRVMKHTLILSFCARLRRQKIACSPRSSATSSVARRL